MGGQGRSFSQAQAFIQDYISDGLVPAANAVTAYKNLAARGYDDTQIQQVMTALKTAQLMGGKPHCLWVKRFKVLRKA